MNLFCLGDSIMQYNDWTSYPQTGWIQMLDRFFQDVTIKNHARNGRSTKSFIAEGRFDKVLKECKAGDFAIIQFAHNDEKSADLTRYTSPDEGGEFRSNLEYFVNELRKKTVKPVLLTPVTRRLFSDELTIKDSHEPYAKAIIETAEKLKVPCIDLNLLTCRYFAKKGQGPSRSFFMNFAGGIYENYPDGKNDDSHLRPDGAYAVCRLFISELCRLEEQWPEYIPLIMAVCRKGIYEDKEIDDEKLMWQ